MNSAKKKRLLSTLLFCFLPAIALAQVGGMEGNPDLSFAGIGMKIVNAIWVIFTVIAIVAFVISGILFLTAFGDPEKIAKARNSFITGIVGVVVAIIAFSAVTIIRNALGA